MQIGSAHDPFSEQLITRIDGNLSSLVTGNARAILLVTYKKKKERKEIKSNRRDARKKKSRINQRTCPRR